MSENETVDQERAEKAKKAQLDAEQAAADFVWLMTDKRGRRVIWRLISEAGIFRTTYVDGNALGMAFKEGRRSSGIDLVNLISSHCPDRYSEMQRENTAHGKPKHSRRTSASTGTSASSTGT